MNQTQQDLHTPQIKICGLTSAEEAEACVRLGADAVGCVFFAKSPRHVSRNQAREICAAVGDRAEVIGVFVNEKPEAVMEIVDACGLTGAQLHGTESRDDVTLLMNSGVLVIKALFAERAPFIKDAARYNADGLLVECGQGKLPGGNAETWDWRQARDLEAKSPLILAGGLSPENIAAAIKAALPDAVDVSSGVEAAPGTKDLKKVETFITSVRQSSDAYPAGRTIRRIFNDNAI
ncbi:MAG: phosphoribosylanthranilate isomerase [Thermodesulfobacteriota bacterium]